MFNKPTQEDMKMETLIGPDTQFQGNVRCKGSIRVDGRVEGGISAEFVVIGSSGEVQGDITAKTVMVGGKVTGNVIASSTLELQAHCQVYGDVRAAQLSISEGAIFEGNCVMTTDKAKVIEMDAVVSSSARS